MRRIGWAMIAIFTLLALPAAQSAPAPIAGVGYRIAATYPHDPAAFTEGLFWHDGALFESTGLEGKSDIRRVRLSDGKVTARAALPPEIFGEGIARWRDEIVSVTWTTGIGYRWGLADLKQRRRFSYPGEGWGMTSDGSAIILSDGTASLRVLDPETFAERRRIAVTAGGVPLTQLNELEWIDGAIWANVWMTSWIVRIDPASGAVTGALDVSALMKAAGGDLAYKTPNGIAWDPATRRMLITGKNWSKLFAITLAPPAAR